MEENKKAGAATPEFKMLQAFETRKDFAGEVLKIEGRYPNEGKRRGGDKRAHTGAPYAELRALFGIQDY